MADTRQVQQIQFDPDHVRVSGKVVEIHFDPDLEDLRSIAHGCPQLQCGGAAGVVTLPRNADEFRALVVALGGHLDDDELVETTLIERGDAVYYDDDGQLVARVTWRELLARFDRFKLDESHGGEPEREPCHQCHGLGCVSCGGEGFAV